MKVKILESSGWYRNSVGIEFDVANYDISSTIRFQIIQYGWIYDHRCVITELPESFCVKKCDDKQKWKKYVKWLNKKYYFVITSDKAYPYYGKKGINDSIGEFTPFGTEIHIDDIIKHIDYTRTKDTITVTYENGKFIEVKEEINMDGVFDVTTNEGRLAYAEKYYPIGTKYKALDSDGKVYTRRQIWNAAFKPRIWVSDDSYNRGIHCGIGLIYHEKTNRWAEILKDETNMETQKISRQGLKEIYSVSCDEWQGRIKSFGYRNPLEDYIDLTEDEVNEMFFASNEKQKSILLKYLKQDDGSIGLSFINSKKLLEESYDIIGIIDNGDYGYKSFWLTDRYNWEIKKDNLGQLCLIPTKKK